MTAPVTSVTSAGVAARPVLGRGPAQSAQSARSVLPQRGQCAREQTSRSWPHLHFPAEAGRRTAPCERLPRARLPVFLLITVRLPRCERFHSRSPSKTVGSVFSVGVSRDGSENHPLGLCRPPPYVGGGRPAHVDRCDPEPARRPGGQRRLAVNRRYSQSITVEPPESVWFLSWRRARSLRSRSSAATRSGSPAIPR